MESLSIARILTCYKEGSLTPTDLARDCIEKSERFSRFEMWETFDPEFLLAQAKRSEQRLRENRARPLEGIPVGVKDIYNTIDFPTQMGSVLWKDFTPGNDARTVYYLKEAGAIVAGKTVTAEFAVHELNKTLNPHDISKTPGTSSSGSAVAVALGVVPVALGTQTAGSIIRPASFCGTWGYKPSFGTIPRTGMLKTTDSLDTIGFFTAFPEDLRLIFDVLRVRGPNYPFSYKAYKDPLRNNKPADRPWRVGFVKTHTWPFAPQYAQEAMLSCVDQLSNRSDVQISEVELPPEMSHTHTIHETIYNKSLSYYFKAEAKSAEQVSDIMNQMIATGARIPVEDYLKALSDQAELCRKMDEFMRDYDVLVCLSTAGEAPDRGVPENPDPALMWTLTYLPSISAPFFHSPNKLPFGLQLVSRRYNDYLLLNFLDFLTTQTMLRGKQDDLFLTP